MAPGSRGPTPGHHPAEAPRYNRGGYLNDLVVYVEADSCCHCCQSDLEVYCHPASGDRIDVCDLLGCRWTADAQRWDGDPRTLVPTSREQITAWFGGADLVPLS